MTSETLPTANADCCLILADGTRFLGQGFGASEPVYGEICFTTGMTGYQETLTDASFAGQIITFTFPHVGNTGANEEDNETHTPVARGLVTRELPTSPSNYRSQENFDSWLKTHRIAGIAGIDTRALTRHIREHGGQNAAIAPLSQADAVAETLKKHPSMEGLDLAVTVTTGKQYGWTERLWQHTPSANREPLSATYRVVAIDYGQKHNILRSLAERGCEVTVVPAQASAEEILALKPTGVFLSNGPGDPAATGTHAVKTLQAVINAGVPVFGICLGHQLLGLAVGGKTAKLPQGHRGANHPVKNLLTGAVEITSQNHGFHVLQDSLPANAEVTHLSLFDGTVEGFRLKDKPVFAVQYHPESSPGPHDSRYLFDQFVAMMEASIQDSGVRIQGKSAV